MTIKNPTAVAPGQVLVTPPLIESSAPDAVKQPGQTGMASRQERTSIGDVPRTRSADPLVAKGLVQSVALALEGSTRDVQNYVEAPSPERLSKLNRGLEHLAKEVEGARNSTDVQFLRDADELREAMNRMTSAYTELLSAFSGLDRPSSGVHADEPKVPASRLNLGRLRALLGLGESDAKQSKREAAQLRDQAQALMTHAQEVLTQGVPLEASASWRAVGLDGRPVERTLPTSPEQIYPTLADGKGRGVPEESLRHHLAAEVRLAQGDYQGAVVEMALAGRTINGERNMHAQDLPPEAGLALLHLADTIVAGGLENHTFNLDYGRGGVFDVTGIYRGAVALLAEQYGADNPLVQQVIARAAEGLREIDAHDAAAKLIKDAAAGPKEHGRSVYLPPLVIPGYRGPS